MRNMFKNSFRVGLLSQFILTVTLMNQTEQTCLQFLDLIIFKKRALQTSPIPDQANDRTHTAVGGVWCGC